MRIPGGTVSMGRRRRHGRDLTGIVLLDKPVGITSNEALQRAKRLFEARKAGHTGSLDPLASGMLPLCFGQATKVSAFLLGADKVYRVRARFGTRTDTADADGKVVEESCITEVSQIALETALSKFRGDIQQVPPMYSALRKDGRRLYELAREGREVEREPRSVTIHSLDIEEYDPTHPVLRVRCSKGTYVRTLVEDIAAAAGSLGHVAALRRLTVEPFPDDGLVSLTALEQAAEAGGMDYVAVSDHVVVPADIGSRYPYSETGEWAGAKVGECLETVTAASYIAAATSKPRLLTSVLVEPHRPAILAAKMLTTLDVLSGGRLTVGCGAGWMEEEFVAIGTEPFAERGRVTDEYIRVFRELWSSDEPDFDGDYARFSDIVFEPKPVQKPLPIWIGGHTGAAIRRAAKYGDGWMPIGRRPPAILDPEELGGKIARLRKLTVEAGRPEDAVSLTFSTGIVFNDSAGSSRELMQGRPEQIAAGLRQYQDLGVSNFIIGFQGSTVPELQENMERFSREVMTLVPE